MQISSINFVGINSYTNKRCDLQTKTSYRNPVFKAEIPLDTYKNYIRKQLINGEIQTHQICDRYKKGLSAFRKLGDFSISEYKNLTQDEIDNINIVANDHIYNNKKWLFYDKAFIKNLNYHNMIANGIKDKLNNLYGEGNYVVVPIGRSLSSIGKCLGYKIGEDNIKLLPMSRAWRFLDSEGFKGENFRALRKYLDSIGLSKKEVKTSGKQYIFMDYCYKGLSLKGTEALLKSDKIYGGLENIEFINIMQFLKDIKLEKQSDEFYLAKNTLKEDIETCFERSRFKQYSTVKECPRLSDINDSIKKPEDYDFGSRIFLFKLLENEMKSPKSVQTV